MRNLVAAQRLAKAADGRIVLAVDASPWLRPDANTSPDHLFCHTYGRGRDQHLMVPGWPYSMVAALETGRISLTAILDAIRLGTQLPVFRGLDNHAHRQLHGLGPSGAAF